MTPRDDRHFARLPGSVMLEIDRLCNRFEEAWRSNSPLRLEVLLKELPVAHRRAALTELLPLEIEYRRRAKQTVTIDELTRRFPKIDRQWLEAQLTAPPDQTAIHAGEETAAPVAVPPRLGDYRILSKLGGGGMGTVYRAVHERMGREVALKVLRPEIQSNPALIQRFDREVRAAARLTHPNIVTALDARQHEGLHFLVTELVEGSDLDHYVRREGPLSVAQAVDVLRQAALGLAWAHAQGVVHRDIKPANLLLGKDGVVRILDMGLARIDATDHTARAESGLTDTGVVIGTAAYMAPEQARDTRRADARSDIYSLGCTLYFLLTGRAVYSGSSPVDVILAHVSQPVPALRTLDPKIPLSLDVLFQKMVAKDPADRVQSAADVVAKLDGVREHGLEPSESAELRHLVAQISVPDAPHPSYVDTATEFHFRDAAETAKSTKRAASWRRHRGQPIAIAVVMVLIAVAGSALLLRPDQGGDPEGGQQPPDTASAEESSALPPAADSPPPDTVTPGRPNNPPVPDSSTVSMTFQFDGLSSYLHFPQIHPEPGMVCTMEAIVKVDRFQTSNFLSWLGPDWMAVYIDDGGQPGTGRRLQNTSHIHRSGIQMPTDRWVHVAATYVGQDMTLFLDGEPAPQLPITFELPRTSGGLYVGGVDPAQLSPDQNQRFFAGQIRAFRVSRGIRYPGRFDPPEVLPADSLTILAGAADSGLAAGFDHAGRPIPAEAVNVRIVPVR